MLFDLEADPSERRNLLFAHAGVRREVRRALDESEADLERGTAESEGKKWGAEGARVVPASVGLHNLVNLSYFETGERLGPAGGPADFDSIDTLSPAEAKVKAEFVVREIAAAAADLIDLLPPIREEGDSRTDRAAIRFDTNKFENDPGSRGRVLPP